MYFQIPPDLIWVVQLIALLDMLSLPVLAIAAVLIHLNTKETAEETKKFRIAFEFADERHGAQHKAPASHT